MAPRRRRGWCVDDEVVGAVTEPPLTTRKVLVPSRFPKKAGRHRPEPWARRHRDRPRRRMRRCWRPQSDFGLGAAASGGTVGSGLPSGPTSGSGAGQLAGGGHARRSPDVGVTSWADAAPPQRARATANWRQWDRIGRSLSRPGAVGPAKSAYPEYRRGGAGN